MRSTENLKPNNSETIQNETLARRASSPREHPGPDATSTKVSGRPAVMNLPAGKFIKRSQKRKTVAAFRRGKNQDYSTWTGRVGVHVEVDSIELEVLLKSILTSLPGWGMIDHHDVIRLWLPFDESAPSGGEDSEGVVNFDAATPEVYVFSFGAVVFWNFPDEDYEREWAAKHILSCKAACGDRNKPSAIESANDSVEFCYDDVFKMRRDVVYLATRDPGEKLAVSYALAKSALVSIFEWRLERTIEQNARIPEELAENGYIEMSRKEVSQEIGRLYLVKHGINLDASVLDTPEEFWDDDRFQDQYNKAMAYFDIMQRLTLVNGRVSMIEDLHRVLRESIHNHHEVFLEWIVIILIVVYLVLELGMYKYDAEHESK